MDDLTQQGIVRAPDFIAGLEWFNVERPLSLADLRGRLVLLDFWTSCCINCQHMLQQLSRLKVTFPDDVVVIGVHTPKFVAEADSANVRASIQAHGVSHPVISDVNHQLWDAYAIRAWPTLVFIDPQGRIIGQHAGELHFPELADAVEAMLDGLRRVGTLSYDSRLPLHAEPQLEGTLAFPSAIIADGSVERLIISDTGHHRIVITAFDGMIRQSIGRGVAGFSNGDGQASFQAPRGLALSGDTLYVADTENHAIRRVDLTTGMVSTVAGTGLQAARFHRGGPAQEVELSSPWDVALSADASTLFVAMAGFHQIWALDIANNIISPYVGTGHEGLKDAMRSRAWCAQPSGLALVGSTLYVVDSETSAIRVVDTVGADGYVQTLIGMGLFDFGDRDGHGRQALLQHPLGICATDDTVWVADTYNNKLRAIDIKTGIVRTVAGIGEHGLRDGIGAQARLWAPSGLSVHDGLVYVADSNNHAIRVLTSANGSLDTLSIRE